MTLSSEKYTPLEALRKEIQDIEARMSAISSDQNLTSTERLTRLGNLDRALETRKKIEKDVKFTFLLSESVLKLFIQLQAELLQENGKVTPTTFLKLKKMKPSIESYYQQLHEN